MSKTKGVVIVALLTVFLGGLLVFLPNKVEMAPRDFLKDNSNYNDETFI